jgi:two-component system, cell cycle response regulator
MTSRDLKVQALGLTTHEVSALVSVCRLSQQAGRPFRHAVAEPGARPDLLVVAMEDPAAVAQWRCLDPQGQTPFVAAGRLPPGMPRGVELLKPFLASRLLAAMDACAARLSAAPSRPAAHEAPPPRDRSILLVDDSVTARRQIESVVRELGITPVSVAGGDDALIALDQHRFDLVLLDVMMPGADGFQVCKSIRRNPRTTDVPVAMLTTSRIDRIRGKLAGFDAFLNKPLQHAELAALMHRLRAPVAGATARVTPAPSLRNPAYP